MSEIVSADNSKNAIMFKIKEEDINIKEFANRDKLNLNIEKIDNRTFLSNTSKFIATDIVNNSTPYYRKTLRAPVIPGHTAVYSEEIYDIGDQFVYSNADTILISMINSVGQVVYTVKTDTYPVFIDSRLTNLRHLYAIDNKTFTIKKKKDILFIHTSKDVTNYISTVNVFSCNKSIKNNIVQLELDEFIYSGAINIGGINSIVKYEYFPYVHNMVTKVKESHVCSSSGKIFLRNKNIDASSIYLVSVNGSVINMPIQFFVSCITGSVDLAYMIQALMIAEGDDLVFSYSYIDIDNHSIDVDVRSMDSDSSIETYVSPTYTATGATKTYFDKAFGAVITKKDFVIKSLIDAITTNIVQSGNTYTFNYLSQNQLSTNDINSFSSFYTSNIDEIDTYLNNKLFKSCGSFKVLKPTVHLDSCGLVPKLKDGFIDFKSYNLYGPNVCILGSSNPDTAIGVKKINIETVYPINFSIERETDSHVYLKIDVSNEEAANMNEFISVDPELIALSVLMDEIDEDFAYNKDSISCVAIVDDIELPIAMTKFFNNSTKELYGKINKVPGINIYIKYNDKISNHGITIWKVL